MKHSSRSTRPKSPYEKAGNILKIYAEKHRGHPVIGPLLCTTTVVVEYGDILENSKKFFTARLDQEDLPVFRVDYSRGPLGDSMTLERIATSNVTAGGLIEVDAISLDIELYGSPSHEGAFMITGRVPVDAVPRPFLSNEWKNLAMLDGYLSGLTPVSANELINRGSAMYEELTETGLVAHSQT